MIIAREKIATGFSQLEKSLEQQAKKNLRNEKASSALVHYYFDKF